MDSDTISVDVSVKSHPIDRILNLHQSITLATIRKQNQHMLTAQYAQCQQMQQLQRQMQANNSMTRQILENQLKEIQHKENLKYYKALAYNIKEAVNVITNTENMVFKSFLNSLFHDVFKLYIQEAKENLEEITDKVFCSEIENALESNLEQSLTVKDEYSKSAFCTLLDSEKDYKDHETQLFEERNKLFFLEQEHLDEKNKMATPKPYKDPNRMGWMVILGICSLIFIWIGSILILPTLLIILLLIHKEEKWRKNYPSYLEEFKQKQEALEFDAPFLTAKKKYDDLETYMKEHPYTKAKNELSLQYPKWEKVLEKIDSCLPKQKEKKDSLLYKIANSMVSCQSTDIYKIRKKVAIGGLRFYDIAEKLERIGIVDMKAGKVKIQNVELLDEYWEINNLPK